MLVFTAASFKVSGILAQLKMIFFPFPLLGSLLPGAIWLCFDMSAAGGPVLALLIFSTFTAEKGKVKLFL